ncbi:neuromedin-U isoform X1 [Hypomesus transpacificus]|uniref:neuromedin-U isoform X1 n=1 Tax=Hypomesus transpacificus TaxID=137520 RepID=UPI001F08520B|nr:neuromedin-U isoform X1 [Hypomesus transpacificus]
MMKTSQCQTRVSQSGNASKVTNLYRSAMIPLSTASITLAVLLISAIPVCTSAPVVLQRATIDQDQLLSQVDEVCSAYLSADLPFRPSDLLGEVCVLMLVQKSKELKTRDTSKRCVCVCVQEDLKGPAGIQSRGYFLYRPRNGRRSLEYE